MPIAALFLTMAFLVAGFADVACAQGAATGGTKDVGSPTMVYPIRPRDEPPARTAVRNRSHHRTHYDSAGRSVIIYHRHTHGR